MVNRYGIPILRANMVVLGKVIFQEESIDIYLFFSTKTYAVVLTGITFIYM